MSCCAPSRDASEDSPQPVKTERSPATRRDDGMVRLPGGSFIMGTDDAVGYPADGEGPVRRVTIGPFRIDAGPVTVQNFSEFVEETGFVTESERFGWSFVFHLHLDETKRNDPTYPAPVGVPWWRGVPGADWRHPEGPWSHVDGRGDHPVTQVSWNDAAAYARWAGKRLPTEAEWEYAARGGIQEARYAWGDELTPGGEHRCNIWQGDFPNRDNGEDGYRGPSPVGAFPPNGFGLFDTAGNVWEWCADWFSPDWHRPEREETRIDPRGPSSGFARSMRGGSFLCHRSYCHRYRVAARTSNPPDSAAANLGFRCAAGPD